MNETCECDQDGFCTRYGREMTGRLRQICRGENVDPGDAAKYRALWRDQPVQTPLSTLMTCSHRGKQIEADGIPKTVECPTCNGHVRQNVFACTHPAREPDEITIAKDCASCLYRPRDTSKAKHLILKNNLSPGDVLVMSAAIYSLHKANPGKFLTAIDSSCPAVWEHNPDVVDASRLQEPTEIQTHYPAIQQCNQRGIHFMQAYCEFLEDVLQVKVPLLTNRPMLYVSNREKSWMSQVQEVTPKQTRYWVINAGRKSDYTTKHWGTDCYQRVVDQLRGRVLFVQVGQADHHHPPLRNVLNLIGKTDARQLIRLVYHADGVLCGVTFLQHMAAALEKPCVCIMGGREPVAWNSYPRQQLMHTIGMMKCCDEAIRGEGCWKSRTVALADGDEKNQSLCAEPVWGEEPVPRCMALIRPEVVSDTILQYHG